MYTILIEISNQIAAEATALAKHARRVTIKREDIILANK